MIKILYQVTAVGPKAKQIAALCLSRTAKEEKENQSFSSLPQFLAHQETAPSVGTWKLPCTPMPARSRLCHGQPAAQHGFLEAAG
jgi:hypothetical protein